MKYLKWQIILLLFFVLSAAQGAEKKEEIHTLKASGSAAILRGNIEQAKKAAVQEAKRNAVDQIGSQVISQTVVENFELVKDRIISKVDGYVHSYRILEEEVGEKRVLVKIEAEVSKSALIDDATLIYHDMEKPRLMILIPEARKGKIITSSLAENVVSDFFIQKGFTLIDRKTVLDNIKKDEMRKIADGDQKAAVKLGLRSGAEAVVVGNAVIGDTESVKGILYASKSTVSVRALRTDNGSLYAVSNKTGAEADGIADAAQRKAVEKASKEAAKDIFWKIVKKWNEEKLMGTDIELILSGVSFSKLRKFKKGFSEIEGISEMIQRSFDSPSAVLNVKYTGNANRLAEILDETKFKGFRLEILSVSPGKINLKIK